MTHAVELAWNFFSTRKDPVISPQVIAEYYSVMLRSVS